jgi:hypothetical protein
MSRQNGARRRFLLRLFYVPLHFPARCCGECRHSITLAVHHGIPPLEERIICSRADESRFHCSLS